jgi:hypothetical protein
VEPLEPDGCFSELKAFNIAFVRALMHWPYCDDPLWSGNLQLGYV